MRFLQIRVTIGKTQGIVFPFPRPVRCSIAGRGFSIFEHRTTVLCSASPLQIPACRIFALPWRLIPSRFVALLYHCISKLISAMPIRCNAEHGVAGQRHCSSVRSRALLYHCVTVPIRALLFHCLARPFYARLFQAIPLLRTSLHRLTIAKLYVANHSGSIPSLFQAILRTSDANQSSPNHCSTIANPRHGLLHPCLMLTSSQRNRPLPLLRHWPIPENRP